ncbi:RNA polymerase sigma factor RpoH [Rugamonas sp.]|uniref:RNA polymerase sigma factor RpoH n=1 Tax=Rugamonas sp. TaxID=1926287 RepID=UPI0025CCF124|nr:RNA polymerase sigma factor RpoH [Rugamonas sp.]
MTMMSAPSALAPASTRALGLGFTGNLGNLDAYISAVNRLPMLTHDEEQSLARRLRDSNDLAAAQELVLSHLRLVVSIARGYLGYGLPHADLIQEGNIGLMKAVKRFDPDQGVRLVSYAMHWIKAEMHEYILKNWRLVKVATTKAQRKLFFNLRSHKTGLDAMTPPQIDALAKLLDVKREEVIEMETRLSGRDIALESSSDDEDDKFSPIAYLSSEQSEPTRVLEAEQVTRLQSEGLETALGKLDPRSRRIVEARWLANDDGSGATLHTLADEFGVSAERIRQIESAALKKMKGALAAYV